MANRISKKQKIREAVDLARAQAVVIEIRVDVVIQELGFLKDTIAQLEILSEKNYTFEGREG